MTLSGLWSEQDGKMMKKTIMILVIASLVFLGLSSGAFCQGRSGGGYREGGGQVGGYHGGGYRGGGGQVGGYYGGGYYGGVYYRGGHRYYGGGPRIFVGGYFGFPWFPYYPYPYGYYFYGYPYYYHYPYAYPPSPDYPYTSDQPPVYSEQEQPRYWYYCRDPEGYYPYVTSCPGGWTRVNPVPPGEEGEKK